ncbi:unnamed protein product [Symbiodinium microadriaticum]|nr:unnamed protein product [Symbiodinium microadriaticum]
MDDRLWRLLEDSGCICVSELRVHFATPWHLACSVDSLEDATVLAEQVMPKALPAEHKRIGGHVWKWISDNTNLLSRVQARLRSKATRIEASAGSKVSPGEVFDQLMSGSLELCKQTSRAHSRWISGGAGTPIEAEKAAKKFWGTVLVQIMVEARLPIVEIPVENEEQRVMYALRALGARRSKTLRNRARTWRKARDWMQSVKGYVFPRSPADVVDYLIFLEQESGTKSCISEFMSALSVLEDAGLGQQDRTFLVFQSSADFEEPCFKFAKPEVISNYMRLIWRQLKVPFKKLGEPAWKPRTERDLLGTECYLFWSGHSMRHVLPTIAAVFGVPKEQRDYLGRWHVGLHQSSDYIHTCRQIVHDIQRRVCDKLSGGKPGYDEEELFEDFGAWLRERGLDPEPWVKRHAILRTVNGCKVLNQTWPLLREFTDRPDIMDPAAQRRYLKDNVDADFVFLLEEHGVELALQYAIGQHYKSIRTFAAFTDDRAGARTAITADFGVRPDSAADRAKIATVITAWEASKLIREEEAKLRAEAKVMGVQKPLASSDRAAMRIALETVRGYSVPESEEPAPEYLAHKLEQIENGEPTASYLDEVISRKESNSLQLQTSLDNQGRLRVMRQKPKGRLPQNTEELLGKIRLEAATWVMLSAKCRGRAYLQDVQLCNLLISTALNVPWNVLLQYEFELRKWAIKEAHREGVSLGDKLYDATRNTELKELHFTSQIALAKRSAAVDPPPSNKWQRKGKGDKGDKGGKDGKGNPKGKTDGKIKIGEAWFDLVSKTPDGRELCYAFNIKRGCQVKGCQRVHACRIKGCQGSHPAYQHGSHGGS